MIDRYTGKEMGHIFSLENKYAIWQEIEVLACEAQAELGTIGITREEAAWIRAHAAFDKDEVDAIEAVTNHDVISFLTNMGSYIDAEVPEDEPKPSRWVHYGMTSTDLGDTAMCYQLVQACDILIRRTRACAEIAKRRAFEERNTLCVGRTHGIHAEPMTFGMKFASWAWELKRDHDRLVDARANVAFGAISGAVGTYSSIDPYVEGEAEEPFRKGQKGSSAMPHKRNPITCEKICGLARVVKANAQVAFDNVALWHERDISHSSAERVAQADSFIALDHMLDKLEFLLAGMVLYPAQMMANLNKTRGMLFSSKLLLALVDTGITREDAYKVVQSNAMAVWADIQQGIAGPSFRERLEADPACTLGAEQLDAIFDPRSFLTRSGIMFDRLETLTFD